MAESKLCMGCMENKGSARICPHCGYAENTPSLPAFIKPGVTLHDRYLVGRLLNANGQGASYIAYDTAVSCKVILNEYMPDGLCVRVRGRATISVNYNNLAQYKALMAEYTELNKSLAKMRSLSSHLSPTLDLFAENNTTYAVYEYIDGIKLVDYLKENAGELSWSEVSAMFPPLFTTLSLVHNAGVVHRGISPENIYVTDKGELKVTDFCISAVRTENTELKSEIYHGYAAPEQYSAAMRQGTWTDVYAICAVLYRILTGSKPDAANIRLEKDNLYTPQELNPNIPMHVSDVIMRGMLLDGDERIQTITELVTSLFDQPAVGLGQTQTITISRNGIYENHNFPSEQEYPVNDPNEYYGNEYDDEYDDGYDEYDDDYENEDDVEFDGSEISTFDRIKIPIIIGVLLAAIILVIIIILMKLFTADSNNHLKDNYMNDQSSVSDIVDITEFATEETSESSKEEVKMPDLVGQKYEDVKSKIEEKYRIKISAQFEYNSDYKDGIIFWQEFDKGKKIKEGKTVKVKVSKGTESVKVPDFEGYTFEEYAKILSKMKIKYSEVSEIDYDVEDGYVIRVSPAPGKKIDLTKGESLTVYYASNPEPTDAPTEEPEPIIDPPAPPAPEQTDPPAPEQTDPPAPEQTDPPVETDPPILIE
ncbi:MAG: PASTA domain-containing protein [Clostridium sp.]|nr:PASTA domain-containing protein [Clostridium sp.]MCM1547015.1 PASTA domain-containing protein [Ruminococcus sp.]